MAGRRERECGVHMLIAQASSARTVSGMLAWAGRHGSSIDVCRGWRGARGGEAGHVHSFRRRPAWQRPAARLSQSRVACAARAPARERRQVVAGAANWCRCSS